MSRRVLERGDSRCGGDNRTRGWSLLGVAREREGRASLGPLVVLDVTEILYERNAPAAFYASLDVIMIIIAFAIFNVLEAGNGSNYYGRSYNPPPDLDIPT